MTESADTQVLTNSEIESLWYWFIQREHSANNVFLEFARAVEEMVVQKIRDRDAA